VDETMASKQDAQKLLGQHIYAVKKDGSVLEGKLLQIRGNKLFLSHKGKQVKTSAILPLVLFDLLAIAHSSLNLHFSEEVFSKHN
jgi:hypothetical protein